MEDEGALNARRESRKSVARVVAVGVVSVRRERTLRDYTQPERRFRADPGVPTGKECGGGGSCDVHVVGGVPTREAAETDGGARVQRSRGIGIPVDERT